MKKAETIKIDVEAKPSEERIVVHREKDLGSLAIVNAHKNDIVKKVPLDDINSIVYTKGHPEYPQDLAA